MALQAPHLLLNLIFTPKSSSFNSNPLPLPDPILCTDAYNMFLCSTDVNAFATAVLADALLSVVLSGFPLAHTGLYPLVQHRTVYLLVAVTVIPLWICFLFLYKFSAVALWCGCALGLGESFFCVWKESLWVHFVRKGCHRLHCSLVWLISCDVSCSNLLAAAMTLRRIFLPPLGCCLVSLTRLAWFGSVLFFWVWLLSNPPLLWFFFQFVCLFVLSLLLCL